MELSLLGKTISVNRAKMDASTFGLSDLDNYSITINSALDERLVPEVVGHELMHLILDHAGIAGFLSVKQTEALCDVVGRAMGELVMNNTDSNIRGAFLCRGQKR